MEREFKEILERYQGRINQLLRADLAHLGPTSPVRDACEFALLHSGSNRVRSSIVLMMGSALQSPADLSLAALGIEHLIVAAKAIDDFPAMDNADARGGTDCLHRKFGEGTALLASYALIAGGFGLLARCAETLSHADLRYSADVNRRLRAIVANISGNIGAAGAALGQYQDLTSPAGLGLGEMISIIDNKTGSLYEMAFVTGWLFGGGDWEMLPRVQQLGRRLGRAMQMQDDIADQEQDAALGRHVNIANAINFKAARKQLLQEVQEYRTLLETLSLERPKELMALSDPLVAYMRAFDQAAEASC